MKGAARRLAAAVEALRGGGGSAAEQQKQQQELVQALIALQRLWKPELLATPSPTKKRSAKSNAALFQLLLATLIVYSGGHTGSSNAGAAGAGTGAMGVSLSTPSAATSECVHRLVCDLLVRAFDFSVVPSINETLAAKNMSLYIKVSLVMVVCRLQPQEALQFLPDAVALANKNLRAADYYMKQCLIESVAHALDGDARRLVPFHAEALKIVTKSFQDKAPEVRVAAARLLQVVAERTSASMTASSGAGAGGSGGSQGGGSGNISGSGAGVGGSGSAAGPGNGGSHANAQGVSLDAILQITAKGMDDVAPEARRAYSVVVGTVLAKFATSSSSGESEMQAGESNGASAASSRNNDEDAGGRPSNEHDTPPSSGSGKAKTGFKLHVPGMTGLNLPASLSRRKAATVNFSTIANVVVYFKDMVTSKYLSSNPNQSHGGILASFSIALCSMFERLPPDSIAESQLREVLDAILAILDHPFALGDLTRARNAVGFVLRYGLNGCLTERQQEVLLGAYLQKLKDEVQTADPNHHKILTALVELSHLFHSMGEASVSHARGASDVFQELTCHEKQSVRFQAAVALASLVTAIPYRLKSVLTGCLQGLRDTAEYLMRGGSDVEETRNSEPAEKAEDGQDEGNDMQSKTHLYAIQGRSAAIAHILRAIKLDAKGGLSQGIMDDIYSISEELVESQFLSECADSIWLTCTRAGWTLVGSLVAMNDETWIKANLEKLLNLWLKSSVLHSRESSLELLRIEAAVIALSSFLANCQGVAVDPDNDVNLLASHILHVYLTATQDTLSNPLKRRGQIARFRLMGWIINCFSMLPPIYSDSYIVLLDLVAEFTTAQALTNLRHSSLVPAKSTYLQSVLSSEDNALDIVTLSRLEPGDYPSPLYSRELNHLLGLLQRENALTDTELEVQYLDTFWRSITEKEVVDGGAKCASCSPFTYVRLVDTSVLLFGRLFHFIPEDLQLRCLQHYAGALTDVRADCEVNVCSLLFAVIAEARRLEKSGAAPTSSASLSATSWPLQMQTMLCELISSENAEVRRGAGEALGTLASLLGEDHCKGLIIELEKRLVVDKLPQGASNATYGSNADLDVSILSAGAAFALACIKRVIAIGESASTFAGAGAEQLMMSPKGLNLGIQATGNDEASGDDDTSSWSPNPTLDLPKADANSLASAAVAAQVDTWRATKASVGDLIALMPPLSRQVRHFAVECVLRVFELMAAAPPMTAGASQTKQLHFDLVAARRYFFEMLSAGAASPISTVSDIGNFLCMYLDEFVTLACHVTTTSTEGDELLMFQCVGLRLLNTLVKNFASARDPEVATGDAYLLDPYRAQLSSAIRHALKQVQVEPSLLAQTMENDKGEETYFYAPLLLEAHGIAGACISAHLIQDKVGLGRILKAVVTPDYGHAHFIGDELTSTALSLANLASVAELLTSSVTEAIAQKDARDDEQRAIATSPLVKAMTNGLSGTTEYLFKCWMDMTFAYGVVMQGCAQWAQLNPPSAAALLTGEPMVMPALQLPLPPVGPTATASAAALSASKALRSLYKRYWPKIVNAMATLEAYMPKSVSLLSTYPSVLLSSAIFHVNTNARDRMEDDTELPAVLRSIPLILKALKECPSKEGGTSSSNFPVLLTTAVNSLMLASKRCSGPSQVEALKSIFLCLSRENLAFARDICCSGDDGDQGCAALFDVVTQAGLCPTEVVCSLCDASEQTRHARAVSIGSRATGSRRNSIASEEDSKHMAEVVQFATTGIVLLHTNEEARSGVVRSVALVQQAICSVASSYHSSSVKEAVVTLSRASTEAVFALARTLETNSDSGNDVLTRIKTSVRGSLEFLSEWLKVDIHSAPGFSMQIVANFAASFPTCLHDDAERFHADVAETASAVLEISPGTEDDGAKRQQLATARAELLRGLHAVVKKLVDVHQSSIVNRYLVALGPSLVETVAEANGYPETAAELAELDEAEGLLRLLTTQLNDAHGAAFVHMLLPRLAAVLSNPPPSAAENAIPAQVPGILARLLLCFAQTHAAAFKEAVAAMAPTLRGVLETALRLALTGSGPAAGARASSSLSQGSGPAATKLDLSRYA
ncbi:hypothetical protein PF004_g12595 [Phytophthora fragariae]|uniref:HEAT repeat-containing protein 5B n=3 Tax=Phytophthora fragariae TaxID=53985 RepID=A0A6G0NUP0_9STRA|nr:hypothetical protein PF004_g12595 [Phytophthora fragariae]